MGISWPAEDVEKLRALWSDGVMVPQIQIRFAQKYSARGIYNKAHNLHLAKRAPGDRWKYKTPKPQHLSENTAAIDMSHPHDEPKPLGPVGDFPNGSGCRWIHGDTRTKDWRCCGHELDAPSPYCRSHRLRAWTRPNNLTVRGAR